MIEIKNKYHNENYEPNQNLIGFFKNNNTKEEFTILEIGCNEGYNLKAIHDMFPKVECYGIDIMQEVIDTAKEKFPEGHFFQMNIEDFHNDFLSLFYDKFDYILLPDVLEHLTCPYEIMQYVVRPMLKSDGKVFINLPNIMHHSILYDLIINGSFTYTDIGLLDFDHKHLFTLREATAMFQATGFTEITSSAIIWAKPKDEEFINFLLSAKNSTCDVIEFKTFTYMFVLEKKEDN